MKISKKYFGLVKIPLILFILLLGSVLVTGFELRNSVSHYLGEFEPVEDALESKRIDLYSDAILLYRYLATTEFSQTLEIEREVEESNHKCTMIDTRLDTYNQNGLLRSELFTSYQQSLEDHRKAEEVKDKLIEEHKEALSLGLEIENVTQKLGVYNHHFDNAQLNIQRELVSISIKKKELENRIKLIELVMVSLIFIFTILFVLSVIRAVMSIKKDLIEPLESIDSSTKKFVEGDFATTVNSGNSKPQVKELESRINSFFSYVKENTTDNIEKKKDFQEHFLKTEYHEILDVLKSREEQAKATTMKDLKSVLHITHPTLVSRLNYLEDHSYISIEKNGRDKIVKLN